jgi:excisionase family DNA binding protein
VTSDDPLLPSGEIARRLGVTPRTISQWVADGRLVPDVVTAGGRYRFRWSSVERRLRELRQRDE